MLKKFMKGLAGRMPSQRMRNHFYRRSLILVLCITSIPMAAVGGTMYFTGRTHIEQQVNRNSEVLLKKAIQRIDGDFAQLELMATQWALDPNFDERLQDIDLKLSYNELQNMFRSLLVMKNTYPVIDRIQLYLRDQGAVISDDGIVRLNDPADRETLRRMLEYKQQRVFWQDSLPRFAGRGESPVTLVHLLPGGAGPAYGALLIHLNKAKIDKLARELTTDPNDIAFIVRQDGSWITRGGGEETEAGALELALRDNAMSRKGDYGSFLYDWKNTTYTVSFGNLNRLGFSWYYVTAAPLSQLVKPVVVLSRAIWAISGLGLAAAFILSWVASRRLYKPIHRLVDLFAETGKHNGGGEDRDEITFIENQWKHLTRESRSLQSRLEQVLPSMMESFLLQLVQGHLYSYTEEELKERMEQFGWELTGRGYAVLMVRLSGFSRLEGRFFENDEQLMTFAAANIIAEMTASRPGQTKVVNFQDLSVGLLETYPLDQPKEAVKRDLHQLAQELMQSLHGLLKLDVTVIIGKLTPAIKEIPHMLDETRKWLNYRDLQETYQILDMDGVHTGGDGEASYPFAAERELVHAVRMGKQEECGRLTERFMEELAASSAKEKFLKDGALQLLGSIQHAVREAGFQPGNIYRDANLFEELHDMRELDHLTGWFVSRVIAPYMEELHRTQNMRMKQLVERVIDTILRDYDKDLSLESCAELEGANPFTLSRAFKHVTGVNFIDYLTDVRVEKAKALLAETDMKINEIAERVGYQPSYLIRVFKKKAGLTPGQFRDEHTRS